MKIIMLRGEVDKRTQDYKRIESCNDMWTRLLYEMTGKEDSNYVMYWGKDKVKFVDYNFSEIWKKNFKYYKHTSLPCKPDIIIARGGFPEYKYILKHHKAFKVYYGAGKRFIPEGYTKYDLILADSEEQKKDILTVLPEKKVEVFFKPSVDNVFYPKEIEKIYDVCFVAAIPEDKRKNVEWVYKTKPEHLKMLQLGFKPKELKRPKNVRICRVDRKDMPDAINKCKVGIVPYGKHDSCPRIIAEFIACGVPIVALKSVMFWKDKYLNGITGAVAREEKFWDYVEAYLNAHDSIPIRRYYEDNLSLGKAARHLKEIILKHYVK